MTKSDKIMEGISFVMDDQSQKVAVQIDLTKHGELWDDFYDAVLAEQRKNEPTISLNELVAELKRDGKL